MKRRPVTAAQKALILLASGAWRHFHPSQQQTVDSLVRRGFLTVNPMGWCMATDAGRKAAGMVRVPGLKRLCSVCFKSPATSGSFLGPCEHGELRVWPEWLPS